MQQQAAIQGRTAYSPDPQRAGARKVAVPDYELIRRVGCGAYGEVWLARSTTGFLRAVKIVWRDRFPDERPFRREFEGIKYFEEVSRSHPSQLALFHVGTSAGEDCFYYVMELADEAPGCPANGTKITALDGAGNSDRLCTYVPHTFRGELAKGRVPAARVLELAIVLTEALSHLHGHGLVHRDIKPSNIIFVDGRPKLADIGLVTEASDEQSIVGTEGYLAPEGPGTQQADIYALGKVLYEAVTGQDRRRFPDLPSDLRQWSDKSLAFELNLIVARACASQIQQRYQSADAILLELRSIQSGRSIKRERAWKRRARAGLYAGASAAIATGLLFYAWRTPPDDAFLKSENPEVNALVDQGERILLAETPARFQQASNYFKRAIQLDPNFLPAYYGLHEVEHASFNFEGIRESTRAMMKLAPNSAEANLGGDFILWIDWRFREALESARRTSTLKAHSKRAQGRKHLAYGFMLLQSGFPDAALEQYQIAEKVLPADTTIKHHLGHPHLVKGDFETALHYYQRSLDLEPNHWLGHLWKGRTYDEMGDYENAIIEYRRFSVKSGRDQTGAQATDDALRAAYREGGAQAYWRQRLENALTEPKPSLYAISTLYARLGEKEKAYEYLERACENRSFTQGLLFDLCWDHKDERFREIARRMGILRKNPP